jgi:hypothetical protein
MKQAEYILETHRHHAPIIRERFIGTRKEARDRCAEIDARLEDWRAHVTHIRFVRYAP